MMGPFLNLHVITHFKAYTITYEELTIPPKLRIEPRTKGNAIHILCIHHKNTPIGSNDFTHQMIVIANTLRIPAIFTQATPSIPSCVSISRNTKWSSLHTPLNQSTES